MSSNLFGFFGKKDKDKDPKQGSDTPVVPSAPRPPGQAGAVPSSAVAARPALVPVAPKPPGATGGAYSTQPLVLPKSSGESGLRPVKPSGVGKSTQRIVLPGRGTARSDSAASSAPAVIPGTVSLPVGMLLRVLPPELCTITPDQFEASPESSMEFSLPLQLIVPQLPSGRVHLTIQDVVPHLPRHYFPPDEVLTPYLGTVVSLPLMDVVMRIPPDVMSLRPDQKGVDAAVLNMADPFTEQLLREAAQAKAAEAAAALAAAQSALKTTPPEAKAPVSASEIIEESEVKSGEEFVPQESVNAPTIPTARVTPPTKATNRIPARPKSQVLPSSKPAISAPKPLVTAPATPVAVQAPLPVVPPPAPAPASIPEMEPEPVSLPKLEAAVPEATVDPAWNQSEEMMKLLAAAEAQLNESVEEPVAPEELQEVPSQLLRASVDTQPLEMEPVAAAAVPVPAAVPPPATAAPVAPAPSPVAVSAQPPVPRPLPPPAPLPVPSTLAAPSAPVPAPVIVPPAAKPKIEQVPVKIEATTPPVAVPRTAENADARKITEPVPSAAPPKLPPPAALVESAQTVPNIDLNTCSVDQLLLVPGCPRSIAEAIVRYRDKNGEYQRLEDLLQVPGMTSVIFSLLTGQSESAPAARSLNELLGFPAVQKISLKDVCDRISSWPNVTGIVLGHATGLPMVGHVPVPFESTTIMAFAPKIFGMVNHSYREFAGEETREIIFPAKGTSFHLFHAGDLYAVVLSNKRSLPRGQAKLLRQIFTEIIRQEKNKI